MAEPYNEHVLQNCSNTVKNKMHGAIKERNLAKVKELYRLHDILPNEEISVAGYCNFFYNFFKLFKFKLFL